MLKEKRPALVRVRCRSALHAADMLAVSVDTHVKVKGRFYCSRLESKTRCAVLIAGQSAGTVVVYEPEIEGGDRELHICDYDSNPFVSDSAHVTDTIAEGMRSGKRCQIDWLPPSGAQAPAE